MAQFEPIDLESSANRPKSRTRTGAAGRPTSLSVAPTTRRAAAKTCRLTAQIPEQLHREITLLAFHERARVNDLVAEILQTAINRRPSFVRLLRTIDDLARSTSDGAKSQDESAA